MYMELHRENQFQDLEWARPRIKRQISHNKKYKMGYSLSGLFTMLRKERHISLIGDYSLMWIIMDETKEISSMKIHGMLRKSEEYQNISKREKMWWFNSLLYDVQGKCSLTSKTNINRYNRGKKS